MTRSGLDNWLREKFLPREQKLDVLEARTTALEGLLAAWEKAHLHRLYLWPESTRVEFYDPGSVPAGTGSLDVAPQIIDGRTMVPLRFVGETLGAGVDWNGESRQITYSVGERRILLTVGLQTATVDGRNVEIDTPPVIIQDRTMVPVRFVSQWLGALVNWDDTDKRVEIAYRKGGAYGDAASEKTANEGTTPGSAKDNALG